MTLAKTYPLTLYAEPSDHHPLLLSVQAEPRLIAACGGMALPAIYEDSQAHIHVGSVLPLLRAGIRIVVTAKCPRAFEWLVESRRSLTEERLAPLQSDAKLVSVFPAYFRPDLQPKPYQLAAMCAIQRRWEMGWGTLADEVGLGKTIVSIGLIAHAIATGLATPDRPAVVMSPSSMVLQWADEIEKFVLPAYGVRALAIQGPAAERARRMNSREKVLLLTWEYLCRAYAHLAVANASILIGDEASRIKNPAAKTTAAFFRAAGEKTRVLVLNATPIETRAEDYWTQIRACDRWLLGPIRPFRDRYLITKPTMYGEIIVGHKNLVELRLRSSGAVLRRTKGDAGVTIPVSASRRIGLMCAAQAKVYRAVIAGAGSDKRGSVFAEIIASAQRAAWSAEIGNLSAPSAKFDMLTEILDGLDPDDRVVVFSRYATIVADCAARLSSTYRGKRRVFAITGQVSVSDRAFARRVFDTTPGSIIVGTSAAERGINLQTASVVIHLDLPWTYAAMRQRVGRVARIGQRAASVASIALCARVASEKPSIDDWIWELLDRRSRESAEAIGEDSSDDLGETFDLSKDPASALAFIRTTV